MSIIIFVVGTLLVVPSVVSFEQYTYFLRSGSGVDPDDVFYTLNWSVSPNRTWLQFQACLHHKNDLTKAILFGIGFGESDVGPINLDVNLLYQSEGTVAQNWVAYTDQKGVLRLTKSVQRNVIERKDKLCFRFERPARNCRPHGYKIDAQTTRIYFFHQIRDRTNSGYDRDMDTMLSLEGLDLSTIPYRLQYASLIKGRDDWIENDEAEESEIVDMLVDNVVIPPEKTTYWCKTIRWPHYPQKRHIIRFEPVIPTTSQGHVHHMELFLCQGHERVRPYNGPCNSEAKPLGLRSCRKVIAAWAMGATGFTFPEAAGLPIGGGRNAEHAVIEIHYENPEQQSGLVDNSGFRLYVTSNLRPHNAGTIELGLVYSARSAIPPRQDYFELMGYCDRSCTDWALPNDGIHIFASQLHAHSRGRKIVIYHIRDGKRLADLNRDDHYSDKFQEIRLLKEPVHVKRGDTLIVKCVYDTSNEEQIIVNGLSGKTEMCISYVFYYPAVDLELCKSEGAQPELDEFLKSLIRAQGKDPEAEDELEHLYSLIDWKNTENVRRLDSFYKSSTLEMHCNMSSGHRFEGAPIHIAPTPVPSNPIPRSVWDKLQCLK